MFSSMDVMVLSRKRTTFLEKMFFFAKDLMIFYKDIVVEDRNGIAGKGLATT